MITRVDLLLNGRTAGGGHTRAQLLFLSVPWPPKSGWRNYLNVSFSQEENDEFVRLRGVTKKSKRDALEELRNPQLL